MCAPKVRDSTRYVDRARHELRVQYRRSLISQVSWIPENDQLIIETSTTTKPKNRRRIRPGRAFQRFSAYKGFYRIGRPAGDHHVGLWVSKPLSTIRRRPASQGYLSAAGSKPPGLPETVIQAGAAAAESSVLLARPAMGNSWPNETFPERPLTESPRVACPSLSLRLQHRRSGRHPPGAGPS